jgi:hypothetical protein
MVGIIGILSGVKNVFLTVDNCVNLRVVFLIVFEFKLIGLFDIL